MTRRRKCNPCPGGRGVFPCRYLIRHPVSGDEGRRVESGFRFVQLMGVGIVKGCLFLPVRGGLGRTKKSPGWRWCGFPVLLRRPGTGGGVLGALRFLPFIRFGGCGPGQFLFDYFPDHLSKLFPAVSGHGVSSFSCFSNPRQLSICPGGCPCSCSHRFLRSLIFWYNTDNRRKVIP